MRVSIKAMRVNRNMTQQEASEKIGVSKGTLLSWENDMTSPRAPHIMKMCEVYDCTLDDIFLSSKLTKS